MKKCSAEMVLKHLSLGSIILLKKILLKKFGLKLTNNQQDDESEFLANVSLKYSAKDSTNIISHIISCVQRTLKNLSIRNDYHLNLYGSDFFPGALFHWSLTCRVHVGEHSPAPLKIFKILKYRHFLAHVSIKIDLVR